MDNSKHKTFGGTAPYMAPEYSVTASVQERTPSVDIWSFGIIMHELMFKKKHPFLTPQELNDRYMRVEDLVRMMGEREYLIPETPAISNDYRELLTRCLDQNPATRATADWLAKRFL